MERYIDEFMQYAKENDLKVEGVVVSDCNGLIKQSINKYMHDRNIYSHTKSFLSLCVGIAIDEGLLSLSDRLVDVLKDEVTKEQYEKFYDVTLESLLMMASGIGHGLLFYDRKEKHEWYPDYLKYVLSHDLEAKPGTRFLYSNADTYMAGRMLEKRVGKTVLNYMYEKVLAPLDIPYPACETDPLGHTFSASGLYINIVDMNKLGIVCLNKGTYNGKRIVSENYINLISKSKIVTHQDYGNATSYIDFNDEYSYFFWMVPNGYRADGAFGQLTIVYPEINRTISIQCSENDDWPYVLLKFREMVLDRYFKEN